MARPAILDGCWIAAAFVAAAFASVPLVALAQRVRNGSGLTLGSFSALASLGATALLAAASWWWWELSIDSAQGMLVSVLFGTIAMGMGWSAGRSSVQELRACPACGTLMDPTPIGGLAGARIGRAHTLLT